MNHETTLVPHGDSYTWVCTCARHSRHQLSLRATDRAAKAHERKYNKELTK